MHSRAYFRNFYCNCGIELLQNSRETRCCKEIDRCIKALESDEVLEDVEIPPNCITNHPAFNSNCLGKWTLRLAASHYKKKRPSKVY